MTTSTLLRQSAGPVARAIGLVAFCGGMSAAFGQSPAAPRGVADPDLFPAGRALEVKLEMPEASWDRVRAAGRSLPRVFAGCFEPDFAYPSAIAQVSIDGETLADVTAVKKGFLGSLSTQRPSLRLDFGDDAHDGRTFHGTRRLTLNNNHQDPSNAKQCVAYELFAQAGLPAPRCGTAHVTVNGVDKGYFTNVEPIGKPFLRRAFGNDGGNLYELTVADFTPALKGAFELKTNESRNDRSDLDRVERALAAPDDKFVEALGTVFDVDEFFTFWAMEVLAGHWDGMTGNRNNTFLYHNPADDRFHPIPWGTDGTFQPHPLLPNVPASVLAFNTLSARLYGMPATRRLYQQRLRMLLDKVWNEDRIIARLRAITAQTGGNAAVLAATETFVRGRRAAIEAELASQDGRGPEVTGDRPLDAACHEAERASGVIDFTWNDATTAFRPVQDVAALQIQIPLAGGTVQFAPGQAAQLATINEQGQAQFGLVGQDATRKAPVFVGILMPVENYKVGTVSFHGIETFGVVVQTAGAGGPRPLGLIGGGTVTFTEVGRKNGDPVRGRWEGFVVPMPGQPPPTP